MPEDELSSGELDVFAERPEALEHEADDRRTCIGRPEDQGIKDEDRYDNVGFPAGGMECCIIVKTQIGPKPMNRDAHSGSMARIGSITSERRMRRAA